MKGCHIAYLSVLVILLSAFFISCDKDDVISTKSVEGHWVYVESKADVVVSDSSVKKVVEEYIAGRINNVGEDQGSYEFTNNKTYYYFHNHSEPLKGTYKMIDKNYFIMDGLQGVKSVITQDSVIYVISNMKSEIAGELNIDENKIIKASVINAFGRGLSLH